MSDPGTVKKKLLQEITGGVRFLRNTSLKSNKSSRKSPKHKLSRSSTSKSSSGKRNFFSFHSFHFATKDTAQLDPVEGSKTDSLKENAKRSKGNKTNNSTSTSKPKKRALSRSLLRDKSEQNTSSKSNATVEKKEKPLTEKVVQNRPEKQSPTKEKLKGHPSERNPSPKHVLYTTYEDNKIKNLLQSEEPLSSRSYVTGITSANSPKSSTTTKVSLCQSCGHVEETIIKAAVSESANEKPQTTAITTLSIQSTASKHNTSNSLQPTKKVQEKGRKQISKSPGLPPKQRHRLQRSLSDPTSSPRKEHKPRILHQRKSLIREAKITQTNTLSGAGKVRHYSTDTNFRDEELAKELVDIEVWKEEIKNSATIFTESPRFDDSCGKMIVSKMKNSGIENYYPLLKTKIPEEYVEEDGSVTLRSTEGVKKYDTDRDSGVDVDNNVGKTLFRNSTTDGELDMQKDINVTPDSALESTDGDDSTEFDFDTLKKTKIGTTEETENDDVDDSTLTRNSKKLKEKEEDKWDMYALLKKFECVEWDLTPASNIKRQTLDLDNCDLDNVPVAVTEIEYYAFRDVEAVSLNHNKKIENADVLGKLTDLRVINMWGCSLKAIPQSWSRLTKLQMLGLGNNRELQYFGPLKHLTNLVWLDLGGCGLKRLPDEVTNMMKLRVLALGGNEGIEIGDEICSLWDLKQLGLNDCGLECVPKAVFSLTKLTHLHIDNNYICQISQEIVHLTELEELTVTGNSNISFPKILSQCDTIKCIIVDQSKDLSRVSGTLKNRMKQMPTATSPIREAPQQNVPVS